MREACPHRRRGGVVDHQIVRRRDDIAGAPEAEDRLFRDRDLGFEQLSAIPPHNEFGVAAS
jgi:hypothetical protein